MKKNKLILVIVAIGLLFLIGGGCQKSDTVLKTAQTPDTDEWPWTNDDVENVFELCQSTIDTSLSSICLMGAAVYNQDISLCQQIPEEEMSLWSSAHHAEADEKYSYREECEATLNTGHFMFRERTVFTSSILANYYNPEEFKNRCQNKCQEMDLEYREKTERINGILKTGSVGGYNNSKSKTGETMTTNVGRVCYCY